MIIEDIPEGYEVVAIRKPKAGELIPGVDGGVHLVGEPGLFDWVNPILVKRTVTIELTPVEREYLKRQPWFSYDPIRDNILKKVHDAVGGG